MHTSSTNAIYFSSISPSALAQLCPLLVATLLRCVELTPISPLIYSLFNNVTTGLRRIVSDHSLFISNRSEYKRLDMRKRCQTYNARRSPGSNRCEPVCRVGITQHTRLVTNHVSCSRQLHPLTKNVSIFLAVLKRCLYKTEDRRSFRFLRVATVRGDEISLVKNYLDMARSWVALFIQYTISFFSDSYQTQKVPFKTHRKI